MKKKLLVVAMLLVVIMTASLLVGCQININNDDNPNGEGTDKPNAVTMSLAFMTSKDAEATFENVDITKYEGKTLNVVLQANGAKFDDQGMLIEFKGLIYNEPEKKFISIYTNLEEYKAEGYGDSIVVDGATYYTSGFGANGLPVNKDAKYLFVQATW